MNTMSASAANLRFPRASRPLPRNFHTTAMVVVLYMMTVLCTPWVIRYAPGIESQVVESLAERPPVLRCAAAPEFGLPCGVWLPEAGPRPSAGTA